MSFIDKHLNDYTLMNYKTHTLVNLGYTLQIIKTSQELRMLSRSLSVY